MLTCGGCGFTFFVHPLPSRAAHADFHGEEYFRQFFGESIESFHSRRGALYEWETVAFLRRTVIASVATS